MSSYDEFCLHYDLDADAPDTQLQYQQYQEQYRLLMFVVGGES